MTKESDKMKSLKSAYEDVIWMAVRYAHGRHTYAPSMVRNSIEKFKKIFPDFELREDKTIEPPKKHERNSFSLRDDYLDDLFKK